MKRLTLFVMTLVLGATTFAQTRDSHGIISQQPEGITRNYIRSGGATYAPLYFLDDPQDGILAEVTFSTDGQKAYFKNIISHAATGTWVEGDIDGNTITIPLGQMVYWFDQYDYGMRLARIKVDGTIKNYTATLNGHITFTIEGDNLILQDTNGDADATVYDGIGLVYTDYINDAGQRITNEWSYYLDYASVLQFKDVATVVPPADLETELYSMEYMSTTGLKTGDLVKVGFSGRYVYVQGAAHDNLPEAWMRGNVQGNKIVFPIQYAGNKTSFMLYFCGSEGYFDSADGNWKYVLGDATFDFNQRTMSFSSDGMLATNSAPDHIDRIEAFLQPRFRPFTEVAATPATPGVKLYQERGPFTILVPDIPLLDTEGNFLNPAKVSYRLYFDDDIPYTLYPDEYKGLQEAIDEVPYIFSDDIVEAYSRSYIYERAYAIYLFQTGFDRIGVQTIYRGDGEERRSAIGYYDLTGNHVQAPLAGAQSVTPSSYDLTGRRVGPQHKGLTISRTPDGRVVKHLQR
ncbi:MAG: hypothetical protein J6W75_07885 [Bacteroidaceae bacterium]|nr:hypothetical protein [Bacteroidaceae bacterium]